MHQAKQRTLTWLASAAVVALLYGVLCSSVAWAESSYSDVRIVIDISGSMKKNDPKNLRVPATKLLVNMIPEGSEAGVWTFGKYVNMLIPHEKVNAAWRKEGLPKAQKINSVALFTNIGEAMKRASRDWMLPDPNEKRSMILLTDGMVDVSKNISANKRARAEITNEILPVLKAAGVTVHTIALSENADAELLKRLAISTDGEFAIARTADELLKIFVRAFDKTVEQAQVPIENNAFQIDGSVEEFTVLIYRTPSSPATQLIQPSGRAITQRNRGAETNWYHDERYDLVTVKNPKAGEWSLVADIDPDNRVTVISDLKMRVEGLPNNIIEGERLTLKVFFTEDDQVITKTQFLSLLDINFSQKRDDGQSWDGKLSQARAGQPKTPEDGIYGAKLGRTLQQGSHVFNLSVDGKTFQRKHSHTMTVHANVLDIEISEADALANETRTMTAIPKKDLLNVPATSIVAQVVAPDGSKAHQSATQTTLGDWQFVIEPTAGPGEYQVTLNLQGETPTGRAVDISQGPITLQLGAMPMDEPVPEPELQVDLSDELESTDVAVAEAETAPAEPEPVAEVVQPDSEAVEAELPPADEDIPEEMLEETVEEVSEDIPEESTGTNWLLIAGAVIGNLVFFAGAFLVYRKIMKRKRSEENLDKELLGMEASDESVSDESEPVVDKKPAVSTASVAAVDDEEATVVAEKDQAVDNADYMLDLTDDLNLDDTDDKA